MVFRTTGDSSGYGSLPHQMFPVSVAIMTGRGFEGNASSASQGHYRLFKVTVIEKLELEYFTDNRLSIEYQFQYSQSSENYQELCPFPPEYPCFVEIYWLSLIALLQFDPHENAAPSMGISSLVNEIDIRHWIDCFLAGRSKVKKRKEKEKAHTLDK
ncbi:hypothetical protein BDZ91DRAFT_758748 [Kalaharituber pfeilii]|nr:hypothetical protein BDZ91DRAFT_758748 [Kalaharituber pfeilii]